MKKKILVIFFLTTVLLYLIYKNTYTEEYTYLAIGDDLAKGHTPFDTYNESYTDYLYKYIKERHKNAKINKEFIEEDLRIKDLLDKIKNAEKSGGKTFTQSIKEAEIITISIGSEELFSKLRSNYETYRLNNKKIFEYIDSMIIELKELIVEMKKIKNVEIYIIGYYNPIINKEDEEETLETIFNYIELKLNKISKENKVHYISIYEEFKNKSYYLPNPSHAFPSLEGYNYIANEIDRKSVV